MKDKEEQNLLCPRCRASDFSVFQYGSGCAGGCVIAKQEN